MQNLRQIAIATYQYMIDYQTIYDSPFSPYGLSERSSGASAEKIFYLPARPAAGTYLRGGFFVLLVCTNRRATTDASEGTSEQGTAYFVNTTWAYRC